MATARVGEVADRELGVRTALTLDAIRDDVATRDVVETRGVVAMRVVGLVAYSVPGTDGARAVLPEDRSALQSARLLPLMQQPKVVQ